MVQSSARGITKVAKKRGGEKAGDEWMGKVKTPAKGQGRKNRWAQEGTKTQGGHVNG